LCPSAWLFCCYFADLQYKGIYCGKDGDEMICLATIAAMDSENDKSKMEKIFDEYYPLMMYIAKGILKDHALAEDGVSDSIEKLMKNIHKVGDVPCHKTSSLIVTIVRNTSLNILKKANRNESLDDELLGEIADTSPSTLDKMVSDESFEGIKAVINSLPPILLDVAELSLIHEYSNKEIAELLEISNDAVRTRLSRVKKIIRSKLGGDERVE
jgi:RNA polymerase sigma-70 factor (ECF subfamily)